MKGNIMGLKPVIGSKSDGIGAGAGNGTTVELLKRILAQSGLGGYSFGFDGGYDVFNEKSAKSIYELERHFHGYEKWFGAAAAPSGETHVADRITLLPDPFRIDAGNDTWGSWTQLLGSDDTPVKIDHDKYDFHKILIVAHENNAQDHFFQIVSGESEDIPAKLAVEDFTEFGIITGGGLATASPILFQDRRASAGEKQWIRSWADTKNTSWTDIYFGIHEYIY